MTSFFRPQSEYLPSSKRILGFSALLALSIESALLIYLGHYQTRQVSLGVSSPDPNNFVEAEIFEAPQEAHLTEEKKEVSAPEKSEPTLSKVPGQGKESKTQDSVHEDRNITQSAPPAPRTHGPIALHAPPPVIPSYLQNQDLRASVVIDFYVDSRGGVNPKLVGSSGNEELDAIALQAVKKWQFRPAEKDSQPVDSKVRLRIVFEVK